MQNTAHRVLAIATLALVLVLASTTTSNNSSSIYTSIIEQFYNDLDADRLPVEQLIAKYFTSNVTWNIYGPAQWLSSRDYSTRAGVVQFFHDQHTVYQLYTFVPQVPFIVTETRVMVTGSEDGYLVQTMQNITNFWVHTFDFDAATLQVKHFEEHIAYRMRK